MNDGPRPKVTERDVLFQKCRIELRTLLGEFWERNSLTGTEYLALLTEMLASDVALMLKGDRVTRSALPARAEPTA